MKINSIDTQGLQDIRAQWEQLANDSGYRITLRAAPLRYRKGAYALIFPNRLETTMRLEKV